MKYIFVTVLISFFFALCANADIIDNAIDTIVVGAGVSGLSAASQLISNGKKIVIVEARERYGGRVNTVRWGSDNNTYVDLGAQWLIGQQSLHPLTPAVKELNAILVRSDFYPMDVVETEPIIKTLSNSFIRKMYKEWNILKKILYKIVEKSATSKSSLRWGMDQAVEYARKKKMVDILMDDKYVEFLVATEISSDYAAPVDELSLWWFDSDHGYGRYEDSFVPQGINRLVRKRYENVWNTGSDVLYFRNIVTKIEQNDNSCVVFANVLNDLNKVVKQNKFVAKTCIVTIPLGVLQDLSIAPKFVPELSSTFNESLHARGVGLTNKIVMEFEEAFWGDVDLEYISLIDADGIDPFMGFINGDNYFTKLPANERPKKHILVGFVAPEFALEVESMSDSAIIDAVMSNLAKVFSNKTIPTKPLNYIISRWKSDPYARGVYSFNKVGMISNKVFKNILKHGERVFFGGEHCSSNKFASINGAHDSGVTAANLVLNKLNNNKNG